ncbi:MAG: tRNA pseudouridine(38-40) synthase TruA [Betaproteobacteria bacterium RBG_19FT_COMBO_58_11]|nr:MAG: tRNA pseudouridine(38-40) synthase TruA [Betaproteobacteria bacterium RBG_19FT_COMBO_58_11]
MVRIALGLEYDGSHFCGWQTQTNACAVQDALEAALAGIACEPISTASAGRTDTGVHALAQVVHFDTQALRPESAWVRGVNALLPPAVSVRWAREVAPEFHARFSAQARRYRYLLLNRPVRPGLAAGRVGWYHAPLDLDAMQSAAKQLLGEHDFSAFRAAECQAKTPVRTLTELNIWRVNDLLVFDLRANAFLHHMVRNIIGGLVYVGKGKHEPEWLGEILAGRDRKLAAPTFAPDGLYLCGVEYPAQWGIPDSGDMMIEELLG